jgi:uncharacterized membrane protein HdeD (DUF308 family)
MGVWGAQPLLNDAGREVADWPFLLLRGVAAMLLGAVAFAAPTLSFSLLVFLFGAYALADGVLAVAGALRARRGERWTMLLLEGIAGILVGCLAITRPGLTVMALVYLVAARAIVTGVMEIVGAIRLREQIDNEWMLALSGIASLGIGALLLAFPGPGALAIAFWIGAYAILFGALLIVLALRLWRWGQRPTGAAPTLWNRARTA